MFFLIDVYNIIEFVQDDKRRKRMDRSDRLSLLFRFVEHWGIHYIRSKFESGQIFVENYLSLSSILFNKLINKHDIFEDLMSLLYFSNGINKGLKIANAHKMML